MRLPSSLAAIVAAGALALSGMTAANAEPLADDTPPPTQGMSAAVPLNDSERVANWQQLKFGMFIHWGVYSQLGGYWEEKRQPIGYPEQIKAWSKISDEDYLKVAQGMTIDNFDAGHWCQLAKDAGMKYLLITTKHHDGFAMWDTKTTDYNVVKQTAFGKDPMKMLQNECNSRGVKLAFYFSIIDWTQHEPEPWQNVNPIDESMMPYIHDQLTELLTNYGPIAELWFDMGGPTADQSERMAQWVHELQPETMVNSRVWNNKGDFEVGGDNQLRTSFTQAPWESIYSTFPACWGYCSWPAQQAIRNNPDQLMPEVKKNLRFLLTTYGYDGQFLLNVGPKGDGSIDPFETKVFREIGQWNTRHPSILAESRPTWYPKQDWGSVFATSDALYAAITNYEGGSEITIPGAASNVTGVTVDAAGQPGTPVTWRAKGHDLVINLPAMAPDAVVSVLRIATDGEPRYIPANTVTSEDATFTAASKQIDVINGAGYGGRTQLRGYVAPTGDRVVKAKLTVAGEIENADTVYTVTVGDQTIEATGKELAEGVGSFALPANTVTPIVLKLASPEYYTDDLGVWGPTFTLEGELSTPMAVFDAIDADTPLTALEAGSKVKVTFEQVVAGDQLQVTLGSDERVLDEVTLDENPSEPVVREVVIPTDVAAGEDQVFASVNGKRLTLADVTILPQRVAAIVPVEGASLSEVKPGDKLTVTFADVRQGDTLSVELHSDPVVLDTVTLESEPAGDVVREVVIPVDTAEGDHHLVALVNGKQVAEAAITVVVPPVDPGTDDPGSDKPDQSGTDKPGTDKPSTDKPAAQQPDTAKPGKGSLAATGATAGALGALSLLLLAGGAGLTMASRRSKKAE